MKLLDDPLGPPHLPPDRMVTTSGRGEADHSGSPDSMPCRPRDRLLSNCPRTLLDKALSCFLRRLILSFPPPPPSFHPSFLLFPSLSPSLPPLPPSLSFPPSFPLPPPPLSSLSLSFSAWDSIAETRKFVTASFSGSGRTPKKLADESPFLFNPKRGGEVGRDAPSFPQSCFDHRDPSPPSNLQLAAKPSYQACSPPPIHSYDRSTVAFGG